MSGWLETRVSQNRHWTETLFSLRVSGPCPPFEAGQFVRIALDIGGERVARPFSFVNAPAERAAEFYGVIVPQGPLSPRLALLEPGDTLYVATNPSGFLVLSEVPDAEVLWLVATGTGLAPFLSILCDETAWRRFGHVVLVHGVRWAKDLTYRDLIAGVHGRRAGHFHDVCLVSRERAAGALEGRIPAALQDGRLEAAAGRALSADRAQVMLCGKR